MSAAGGGRGCIVGQRCGGVFGYTAPLRPDRCTGAGIGEEGVSAHLDESLSRCDPIRSLPTAE